MSFFNIVKDRFLGRAPWDANLIENEWFRSHFFYAADIVHGWLGEKLDLRTARLLNFGCGDGITDLALVLRHGANHIHGVDIRREYQKLPPIAKTQLGLNRLPGGLSFSTIKPFQALHKKFQVDAIFSWSTFEHVQRDQLETVLKDLFLCIKPGGLMFIQIEPLYFSPYGSHLRRYIEEPWFHLLASEDEIWSKIQAFNGELNPEEVDFGFDDFGVDGYKKFVFNEYQALNRLTSDELVSLLESTGFNCIRRQENILDMQPPPELHTHFSDHDLRNNEVILLLQRPV